ncbi:hypothetical protein MKY34_08535 [Sporosarcina sp. FSL K6-1522]|uniref:hypothetical protein n=1 Tax=Sporosarcina sp. FSL K6-1522 TaxID=2921554 RepID=UPI00315B3B70
MRRAVFLVVLALLITGCSQEFKVSEVAIDNVSSDMQDMIEDLENGNYLFSGEKVQYVFLNRIHVVQGEEAIILNDFSTDVKDQVLTISFNEASTSDYENKDVKHQLLYKITGKGDYDTILFEMNGKEIPIDSVITMN